jgi:PucR family transcriptional regulator, purine catabolism regulatory protein
VTYCHPGQVQPTLRAILDSSTLRTGRPEVLTGHDRLDCPVRWVHVAEVRDVSGLLRGGELVLTTGLPLCGNDPVGYVDDLVGDGAAGLVVELGELLPRVPEQVLTRARAAGFPVVALHAPVRFVEVTEQVHRTIVSDQFAEVDFTREVHETYTALSLERADTGTIVRVTADLCGSVVVLEDAGRRVIAFAARSRPAASLLSEWERRSRQAPQLSAPGITGPEGWFAAPVGVGEPWARLVVPDPTVRQSRLRMVLERAAQALELGRMVERDRLGLHLQAQGGLLSDLLNGTLDEESARARAAALGLPTTPSYVAVAVRPDVAETDGVTAHPVAERRRARALVERLTAALPGARLHGLTGVVAGREAGLLLALPSDEEPTVGAALDRVADLAHGGVVGVGPVCPTVHAAGAGLRQALQVADVVESGVTAGRRWYRAADVRLQGLLALLHDDPRVQVFVEAELGPLLAHETRHGDGLLDLLRDYVAAGGRMTRLAQRTHRSRPATYKKVARLGRVLGCDLSDPASLMAVGVALLAYDQSRQVSPGAPGLQG